MPHRPASSTILSPTSRRLVAGLLIASGILLFIAELLRLYVVLYSWQALGVLSINSLPGVLLGVLGSIGTSYIGWRVGTRS